MAPNEIEEKILNEKHELVTNINNLFKNKKSQLILNSLESIENNTYLFFESLFFEKTQSGIVTWKTKPLNNSIIIAIFNKKIKEQFEKLNADISKTYYE
ncbi:MAG: hypothetical protein H7A23_09370 [Leptospiraceae bacterium]|nr:hypothetical protein [Leptospiraceae bacterium]MCP5494753.1 hypothetical protein [Leptospiraceae bacterium]